MPLRKTDDTQDHGATESVTTTGKKFPPEAYAYDSDITPDVVARVRAEANKILSKEKWEIIDGVDKR